MAIGWLTLLKHVPWSDVISSAPAVADGAKKLWSAAARKPQAAAEPVAQAPGARTPQADAVTTLQAQVAALEASAADAHGQIIAMSELIKALADHNAEMIKRVEANRVRLAWLSFALAFAAVVAAGAAAVLLTR
jgi:hypothetical protein